MERQKAWPHPLPPLLFAKTVGATFGWASTGMTWLAIVMGILLYSRLLTDCQRAPSGASLWIVKADSGQRRPRAAWCALTIQGGTTLASWLTLPQSSSLATRFRPSPRISGGGFTLSRIRVWTDSIRRRVE